MPAGAPQSYTIKAGDTLSGIGQRFGVDYNTIAKANGIANPNAIRAGATISIPGVSTNTGTPAPTATPAPQSGSTDPHINPATGVWDDNYYANVGSKMGNGGMGAFGNAPSVPNLQATYDQYYTNNPDVQASQASIKTLQGQLTQRQQALDTATKNINDNPFYAEATRVGKVAQLNNEAQNDMNTLTAQLGTHQANVANAEAEAQRQVNLKQGQYSMENQAWQQNLQEFNNLMSSGGIENASPQTLASLSVSTGIPVDMLSSMQQSQQAKNIQVMSSTDNSGNVTIAAVNTKTGAVTHTTTLSGIGASKTGGSGAGGKVTSADLVAQSYQSILQDIKSGIDLQDLVKYYTSVPASQGGLTTSQVYAQYAQHAKVPPKETLAQVNKGQFANMKGFQAPVK